MKNLAIIPARGGSKRIPRKNIKDFLGKPIIAYSIETALESGLFDEVMVSTDDEEIADVAKEYGAKVPFMRSEENADDHATLADVIDEVKESYVRADRSFEYICCILATAPFIDADLLEKGLKIFKKSRADSVKPVVRFSYPIQRAVRMNQEGLLQMFQPEHEKTRSQDLEPAYRDAGQFYWCRYKTGMRGNKKIGFEVSELLVQDIDTHEDWEIAKIKYLWKKQRN
ncbi:pseudaminic acid cytidylyltransferase [Aliifodinibius sp. S!AR15-10]|uniref:pseudaminic acid cytidylyltransferase n=1 Tax=Aliifodinibius sp. S!AR15-10 TaxID=2950437 RepID=UPI0028573E10|nr:pseudaminic acid cytidylyltransferase [Aliifodinibius sp. S!AR15-10]MDR8393497.1 pseudaminic acid cytidylyltransferase [Aliifodinibius sp. S!AR15-10]